MAAAWRHLVVLLLAASQLLVGASAGRVMCIGGGDNRGGPVEAGCSHHTAEAPLQLPSPATPHPPGDDHDCPCIDVAPPVARPDAGKGASCPAPLLTAAELPSLRTPVGRAWAPGVSRPPEPERGLRTVRLLI